MNTFNVSKRCIWTYEQFLKDKNKAEKADHDEKGEADIVKKSMDGEVDGKKGYATLESLNENAAPLTYGQLLAALQELNEEQLKMSALVLLANNETIPVMDTVTLDEMNDDELSDILDDNEQQPLLLTFVK